MNEQYIRMTTTPVEKLVGRLAIPTIISMMVTNIYNIVDTAFVGKLGTSASGAVGVVFGFMAIIQAVGFMCGQGAGSIMSRKLGEQHIKEASGYASTGFFQALSLGAVIAICGGLVLKPLVYLLGSTPTIEPYAIEYIGFILCAVPFMTSSFTLNNLLRYEGKAKLGMIGLLTGSIINIGGDALFMFVFDMGVKGAGLATALSQIISFCILLSMFLSGKTQTTLSIRNIFFSISRIGDICGTGFPSLLRQSLNSISTVLLNNCAAVYGDHVVSAMSIVSRVTFFVMSIAIGIGQGFQPVSSFNYGAEKYDRVRKAYWFTFYLAEGLLVLFAIPTFIFGENIIRALRDDSAVVEFALRALRLQCVTMLTIPITMVTEMGFQSTGFRGLASFSSSLRSGIIFIPTLVVLYKVRGEAGIQEAQPVAFVLSFLVFIFLTKLFLSRLKKLEIQKNNKNDV